MIRAAAKRIAHARRCLAIVTTVVDHIVGRSAAGGGTALGKRAQHWRVGAAPRRRGLDLDRLVERHGPLPPERVVHVLLQACHSLGEAHAAGLVHRDIKPANIFLARLGRDVDVVKVLDFGLATRPVTERLADAKASIDGNVVGTPAYMAPEQVLGDPTIDGRADLYALGLVAWWLLTGRDAFRATSASQAMFAHVNVDADAPSEFARVPLPSALDTIVLRCLAKRREDRFQDADELARALTAVALDTPWTREPPAAAGRCRRGVVGRARVVHRRDARGIGWVARRVGRA